jgi:hypothetical protein
MDTKAKIELWQATLAVWNHLSLAATTGAKDGGDPRTCQAEDAGGIAQLDRQGWRAGRAAPVAEKCTYHHDRLDRADKQIYSSSEFDKLALQFVVPKLGVAMRDDFAINPAAQDMSTFEAVVPWHKILRASMFTHLFDVEFWPKWLDILYIWLASPGCKADEVASW